MKRWPPVLRAFAINAGATASGSFLAFLRSALMARILAPEAFGLFGIATMAVGGIQVLADFGLKSILISQWSADEARSQSWIDTIWTMELVRGFVAACAVAVLAKTIGAYFNEPDADRLIYVLAFAIAVSGFVNTGMYVLERRLEFKRVVVVEQAAACVSLVVAIVLGLWLRSAHALAWAAVASAVTTVSLSFAMVPIRPRVQVDPAIAREAARAGGSLLLIGVLTFLTTQFDNAVIGRVAGTEVLGVYLVAYTLAMLPVNVIGTVASRVLLPDYAGRAQLDRELALDYWARAMRGSAWLLLSIVLPMWLYGDFILAGPVLSTLAFVGFARGIARTSSPMLLVLGRQDFDAKAKIVETVIFIALVLALVGWFGFGMRGAAWAGLASYGLAAVSRIIFLAYRRPKVIRSLSEGFARMIVVSVSVVAVSAMLTSRGLHQAVAVCAVTACVLLAGLLSEPQLRANLFKGLQLGT
jgi:O-antigen/teichoic acid export membrane protein